MADNYLERRFEEYQAQKNGAKGPKKHSLTIGKKPGYINVKFPTLRVLVTGGANGIGKAIVEAFRKADCKVAFCDIDNKQGQATAEKIGAQFHPVDVKDCEALGTCMERIFKAWDDIDVIINNVGITDQHEITAFDNNTFDTVMHTNLRPIFVTARKLVEHRKQVENPYGRIINISCTPQAIKQMGNALFAASKGAVDATTKAFATSLKEYNIKVNSISAGMVDGSNIAESIAKACIFLCQTDNEFINGENINIGNDL